MRQKIILLVAAISLFSCTDTIKTETCDDLLAGSHELRRFNVRYSTKTESTGSWFLVVGSYSSTTTEESRIRFYFKNIRNEYVFKEMAFEDVYVNVDSNVQHPYVKFYWLEKCYYTGNYCYDNAITKAVIYCRDDDFIPEININEMR